MSPEPGKKTGKLCLCLQTEEQLTDQDQYLQHVPFFAARNVAISHIEQCALFGETLYTETSYPVKQ